MWADRVDSRAVLYVGPGQLTVCTEPCRLRTVLGSCISVCLYDPERRQGGMNHFMLPESPSSLETSPRYGNHAMPQLVERLERLGSSRRKLCASVYGGAHMSFASSDSHGRAPAVTAQLGRRNAEFALEWLEQNGIGVIAQGLLGHAARRLDFDIETGACAEQTLGAG